MSKGGPILGADHLMLEAPRVHALMLEAPRVRPRPRGSGATCARSSETASSPRSSSPARTRRAAELLGVSRRTLTNKLNAYGIARPRKKVALEEC